MKSRAVVLQVVVITVFSAPLLCVCLFVCFGRLVPVFGIWEGRLYLYIALETEEEEEEEEEDDDDDDDYIQVCVKACSLFW
jgi:hypothetical protein